jgi:hypothetical protein
MAKNRQEPKMIPKTANQNTNSYSIIKNRNIFDDIVLRIKSEQNGATVIVPHVCNNINAFGAGFAGQVAEFYPEVKANFHMLGQKAKLGHTQFITVRSDKKYGHSIIFANMIAQNRLLNSKNKRPLNYAALVYCMNQVRTFSKELQNQHDAKIEIHSPKFGSGLAGGNWNFISELINDVWYDSHVFVYFQ